MYTNDHSDIVRLDQFAIAIMPKALEHCIGMFLGNGYRRVYDETVSMAYELAISAMAERKRILKRVEESIKHEQKEGVMQNEQS